MADDVIVFFEHDGCVKPVLKVRETAGQVILAFIPFRGEHLTLHEQTDDTILRTHMAPTGESAGSTWDEVRVEAARAAGYKDPERHGRYYHHAPLQIVQGMPGYHLVGRRIDLDAVPLGKAYARDRRVTVEAPSAAFMLTLYLSRPEKPYDGDSPHRLATALGDIVLELSS